MNLNENLNSNKISLESGQNNKTDRIPRILSLVLIIVILVSLGAVYYLGYKIKQQNLVNNENKESVVMDNNEKSLITQRANFSIQSPIPSPTISEALAINLSEVWSLGTDTYSNTKLNITVDYPSYFEVVDFDSQEKIKTFPRGTGLEASVKLPLDQSNFLVVFKTPDIIPYEQYCSSDMRVSVQQFNNSRQLTLDEFIEERNNIYPGDGVMESFSNYKKNLISSEIPKINSYVFEGIIFERPVKEVYFDHKDNIYEFHLAGGCHGLGLQEAERVFDTILRKVKLL